MFVEVLRSSSEEKTELITREFVWCPCERLFSWSPSEVTALQQNVSIRDEYLLISEANKTLNSYLKRFINQGKLAGIVLKNPS